jgi:hypothetical protein
MSNPPNRFTPLWHVRDPDWTDPEDPASTTQFFKDTARSILTANASPDVGFTYSKCWSKSFLVKYYPPTRDIVCNTCAAATLTSGVMIVRYVRPLTESQQHTLAEIMKYDATPRARVRAHGILLSAQEMKIKAIAKIDQVYRDTVATGALGDSYALRCRC